MKRRKKHHRVHGLDSGLLMTFGASVAGFVVGEVINKQINTGKSLVYDAAIGAIGVGIAAFGGNKELEAMGIGVATSGAIRLLNETLSNAGLVNKIAGIAGPVVRRNNSIGSPMYDGQMTVKYA